MVGIPSQQCIYSKILCDVSSLEGTRKKGLLGLLDRQVDRQQGAWFSWRLQVEIKDIKFKIVRFEMCDKLGVNFIMWWFLSWYGLAVNNLHF